MNAAHSRSSPLAGSHTLYSCVNSTTYFLALTAFSVMITLRTLLAWLVRRQRLVLAEDISLPRHCDYLPAAVVRVCVYKRFV